MKRKKNINVLVTGGAGFIGRWIVKKLLAKRINVWVIDNLDNSREENLAEFKNDAFLKEFIIDDIRNRKILTELFKNNFNLCIHLAAQINVQESLENPQKSFEVNAGGTFNILEEAKISQTKVVLVSTCMVYDMAKSNEPINENYPLKPISPYAASKISAENLALSYYYSFGLPIVILRPFNTYGPWQKSNHEGGVVSVFIENFLKGQKLKIFGSGKQTRDFLYVEDCADFIVKASFNRKAVGQIINAGSGCDISINDLAYLISKDKTRNIHFPHHHPQAEIYKLVADASKAKKILSWQPKIKLETGIDLTKRWIEKSLYESKNS